MNQIADQWKDYECIDAGNGEKLERWNDMILRRPDPLAIWSMSDHVLWKEPHAHYHRSKSGGGNWEFKKKIHDHWVISYKNLHFKVSPTGFKHTGLFPEQAANWDVMQQLIQRQKKEIRVLNLFAYTGGATLSAAAAGASVTHVDASKGMVTWAKENAAASGLKEAPIRWLVDDCVKFVEREIRRENHYDAIIMDPPSYGRGPKGEIWKMEESIHSFLKLCTRLLSDQPLFVLINSYTTGLQPAVLAYLLEMELKKFGGKVTADEVGLPVVSNGLILPCGACGRFELG